MQHLTVLTGEAMCSGPCHDMQCSRGGPQALEKYHAKSRSGNNSKRSMHRQLQKLPRSSVCHDKSRRRPELRARRVGERTWQARGLGFGENAHHDIKGPDDIGTNPDEEMRWCAVIECL